MAVAIGDVLPGMVPPGPGGYPPQPVPVGAPSWYQTAPPATAEVGQGAREYFQQLIANMLLPQFLEPTTQAETARWLGRSAPTGYAGYQNIALPTGAGAALPPGQLMTPEQLALITSQLDYNTLMGQVPEALRTTFTADDPERKQALADVKSGIDWMREYLQTGAQGLGPGKTRSELAYTAKHLETLGREAQAEPGVSGLYATLAENILNPVTQRAPLSGLFGRSRALSTPSGEYRRGGVAFRNPTVV